jgi:hypothetical protein
MFINLKVRESRETSIRRKKDMAKEEGEMGRGGEGEKGTRPDFDLLCL